MYTKYSFLIFMFKFYEFAVNTISLVKLKRLADFLSNNHLNLKIILKIFDICSVQTKTNHYTLNISNVTSNI